MQMRTTGLCASLLVAATLLVAGSAQAQDTVRVKLNTSEGDIVLELNQAKAPKTVANFLKYVKNDHYQGTIFHRVIPGFMIQGGGLDESLKEKDTLPPVENEAGNALTNDKYTLAMARTADPDSATSQFFINTSDNAFLNRNDPRSDGSGYTVFGKVVEGQDVVDKIAAKPTKAAPDPEVPGALMRDVPIEPVVIKDATVVTNGK